MGQITRAVLINQRGKEYYQKVLKPLFPPYSTLGVLGIVFVAIALQARFFASQPLVFV